MSKKLVSILLAVALMVTLLAGCGKKAAPEQGKTGKTESKEPVTIAYGIWDKNQQPVMQQLADEFHKTHQNITVKIELTPYKEYFTKLETAATGGTLPDVFWMNGPNLAKYAKAKMLMPITDKIKSDNLNLSDYPKGLVDLYTLDGQNYAIPKDWDTTALWYNKQIFDDAKVPYPDGTWDWNKLREVAKKLTDKSKGIYGIAAPIDDPQVGIYNTIMQAGGYVISPDRKTSGYDKPETIQGVQALMDLINDGSSPNAQQIAENAPANLFESGKIAMTFQGSWIIPEFVKNDNLKGKIDLVEMPTIKQKGSIIHGLGNVISSKSKNQDAAWEFVKFLSGKEANEIIAKSGAVIPAYKPVLQTFIDATKEVNVKAYVNALDYSTMYPCSVNTAKWNTVETDTLKQVWAGQISAEEGCKKIAGEMNKILQSEK